MGGAVRGPAAVGARGWVGDACGVPGRAPGGLGWGLERRGRPRRALPRGAGDRGSASLSRRLGGEGTRGGRPALDGSEGGFGSADAGRGAGRGLRGVEEIGDVLLMVVQGLKLPERCDAGGDLGGGRAGLGLEAREGSAQGLKAGIVAGMMGERMSAGTAHDRVVYRICLVFARYASGTCVSHCGTMTCELLAAARAGCGRTRRSTRPAPGWRWPPVGAADLHGIVFAALEPGGAARAGAGPALDPGCRGGEVYWGGDRERKGRAA